MNRARITVALLISIIIVLAIIRTIVLDYTDNLGYEYRKYSDLLSQARGENDWIEQQIAVSSALTTVQRKALEQGFVQMEIVALY
jgi:uncharacterized membrane protein